MLLLGAEDQATGSSPKVAIHHLSDAGLLLETHAPLALGERFEVLLPQFGAIEATVVWSAGPYFGCQFAETLPSSAVEAAEVQDTGSIPDRGSPRAVSVAAHQIRELSMAIERIKKVLDRAIDHLSKPKG